MSLRLALAPIFFLTVFSMQKSEETGAQAEKGPMTPWVKDKFMKEWEATGNWNAPPTGGSWKDLDKDLRTPEYMKKSYKKEVIPEKPKPVPFAIDSFDFWFCRSAVTAKASFESKPHPKDRNVVRYLACGQAGSQPTWNSVTRKVKDPTLLTYHRLLGNDHGVFPVGTEIQGKLMDHLRIVKDESNFPEVELEIEVQISNEGGQVCEGPRYKYSAKGDPRKKITFFFVHGNSKAKFSIYKAESWSREGKTEYHTIYTLNVLISIVVPKDETQCYNEFKVAVGDAPVYDPSVIRGAKESIWFI